MLRATVAVMLALMFAVGVVTIVLAQYGPYGGKPDATKPSGLAPTSGAKQVTAKPKSVSGKIKSLDAGSLVVEVPGKTPRQYTFALAGATIKVGGKEGTSTDLKEGDAVQVMYTESDGKLTAKRVAAKTARAKK